jgi:hypothetical protein
MISLSYRVVGDFAFENFPDSELYIILLFMYVGAVSSGSIQTDCGPQRPTRIFTEITLVYGRVIYTYIFMCTYIQHTTADTAYCQYYEYLLRTCVCVMRVRFEK